MFSCIHANSVYATGLSLSLSLFLQINKVSLMAATYQNGGFTCLIQRSGPQSVQFFNVEENNGNSEPGIVVFAPRDRSQYHGCISMV